MDNNVYEVERDEYATFIGQLNKQMMDIEDQTLQNCTYLKIRSKKTNKHLCTRVIDHETGEEKYFIFTYPDEDERIEPIPVRKITLETKEEVQAFFDALNKLQMEKRKHD